MMNTDQNRKEKITKVYAGGITVMLFAAAVALIMYHDNVNGLRKSMDDERIKSESLLSQKLNLEKEVGNMINELSALKGQNSSLTKKWKDAVAGITERDAKINGMTNENKKAKALIAEVETLRKVKIDMNSDLDKVKSELAQVMMDNRRLTNEVAALEGQNSELNSTIAMLNQVTVNNSLVEATKGKKDRLTVAARNTKKLKVGFDLPVELVGNIYFKMMTPEGKAVTSDESSISFYETSVPSEMYASNEMIAKTSGKKHIEMVYKPESKLESGIYKIDVYSGDKYLGTTRVHLK